MDRTLDYGSRDRSSSLLWGTNNWLDVRLVRYMPAKHYYVGSNPTLASTTKGGFYELTV
jgi:hypothetical protein